jgi:hypothetical protein
LHKKLKANPMITVVLWAVLFSASTSASVTLIGSRDLIGNEIKDVGDVIAIGGSWRFITSMIFALISRILFVQVNRSLLAIEGFEESASTLTVIVTTTFSLISVIISNSIFLDERLTAVQFLGIFVLILGLAMVLR